MLPGRSRALLPRSVRARIGPPSRAAGARLRGLAGRAALTVLAWGGGLRRGTILTAKFDALGGRLGDLLNGQRLAEALGTRFQFYWPDRDLSGIEPADRLFAPAFLADHAVTSVDLSGIRRTSAISVGDLWALRRGETLLVTTKDRGPDGRRFVAAGRGFPVPDLRSMAAAFASLPLRGEFHAIRAWAADLPPFDVAIHVRRGDIHSGEYRLGGHFADKAIPLPVVARVLARIPATDRVLLIGEDPERVAARLGATHDLLLPSAFVPPVPLVPGADAMRDLCLLARSRRIIAQESVFALVAARIAGIDPTPPEDLLGTDEIARALLEFVRAASGGPDLEVALACEHLRVLHPTVAARHEDELVAIAHRADPGNPVYLLRLVADALRAGDRTGAQRLLDRAVDLGIPDLLVRLLHNDLDITRGVALAIVWGGFLTGGDLATLRGAAPEVGWCAFVSALEHAAEGAFGAARAELAATASLPDHPAVHELEDLLADPPARVPSRRGGSLLRASVEEGVV